MAREKKIIFQKLLKKNETNKCNIFYVEVNSRSKFSYALEGLDTNSKDDAINIIKRMAENGKVYKSSKIRWKLKNYDYGEIKPKGHRIFFFMRCWDNIIFFNYEEKKTQNLKASVYKRLQKEMEEYAEEFKRYISKD